MRAFLKMGLAAALAVPLMLGCGEDTDNGGSDDPAVVLFAYGDWTDSTAVYLNTTDTLADIGGVVTHFPVVLRLTPTSFPRLTEVASGGVDLRFNSASGVAMPYEIERWIDDSLGIVWVLVDSIYPDSNGQFFYMYWGNASAVSESDGGAVFDTTDGYQGVWHFEDFSDATDKARNAIPAIVSTERDGMVGRGQRFDEVNKDSLVVNIPARVTTSFTVSAWVRALRANYQSGSTINILQTLNADTTKGYAFWLLQNQPAVILVPPASWNAAVLPEALPPNWIHYVATYSDSTLLVYVNGKEIINAPALGFEYASNAVTILGGCSEKNSQSPMIMEGDLDEIRECNTVWSPDFIKLCHANQRLRADSTDALVRIGN